MGAIQFFSDKLANVVANLGTPRDKASAAGFVDGYVSQQQIDVAYRTDWLARKIIDIPVMDGLRSWRDWQADANQISAIEGEEKRLGLKQKLMQARRMARLHGGAAIYIGTGNADLTEPIDPERVSSGGIQFLTVLSRTEITAGEAEANPELPGFGYPRLYTMQTQAGGTINVHPSRFILFGVEPVNASHTGGNAALSGWGESALAPVFQAILNASEVAANVNSLVYEAKVDVVNVPNLMTNLAQGGKEYEGKLVNRFGLARAQKGINGMLMLDGDETHSQKSASFSQLPELIGTYYQLACGAADIPATRLLGVSPKGLQSTGDGEERNYYDRIEAEQELLQGEPMRLFDECLIRSALGTRPDGVWYTWAPLRQTSEAERAKIGLDYATVIEKLSMTGHWESQELREAGSNALIEAAVLPGLEQAMKVKGGRALVDLGQEIFAEVDEDWAAGK